MKDGVCVEGSTIPRGASLQAPVPMSCARAFGVRAVGEMGDEGGDKI